eukprot:7782208-Pyramimonas_sp.AAC.1
MLGNTGRSQGEARTGARPYQLQYPGIPVEIQPMHYAEFLMHDESPHTLRFDDFLKSGGRHRLLEAVALAHPGAVVGDAIAAWLPMKLAALGAAEAGPMKLLQIRTEYAMLLRIKDNRRHGAISYCMVSGEQPNHLQLIDRCTGENCRQCVNNVSGASLRRKAFEQCFRG